LCGFIKDRAYNPSPCHLKWLDINGSQQTDGDAGGVTTLVLDGDCTFDSFTLKSGDVLNVSNATAVFDGDYTVSGGTTIVSSGTMVIDGTFTNGGTFIAGTSTVILTNSSSTLYNNAQAFYNLTVAPGGGNTVTLPLGQVSAVQNLLHVVSGTCHIDDRISGPTDGLGTWSHVGGGVNVMPCGGHPYVAAGATRETGNPYGPEGSLFKIW